MAIPRLVSCRICGGWHSTERPWPDNCKFHWGEPPNRSLLPHPMVISDIPSEPFQSMKDGRWFESKSSYRKSLREGDNPCIEVGNDAPTTVHERKGPTIEDVGLAYQMVRDGYKPAPLEYGVLPPDAQ